MHSGRQPGAAVRSGFTAREGGREGGRDGFDAREHAVRGPQVKSVKPQQRDVLDL